MKRDLWQQCGGMPGILHSRPFNAKPVQKGYITCNKIHFIFLTDRIVECFRENTGLDKGDVYWDDGGINQHTGCHGWGIFGAWPQQLYQESGEHWPYWPFLNHWGFYPGPSLLETFFLFTLFCPFRAFDASGFNKKGSREVCLRKRSSGHHVWPPSPIAEMHLCLLSWLSVSHTLGFNMVI